MLFYLSVPVISALIGWVTNYLAIKMLFHPREPKRILFFTLQGIFPKRKANLAKRLGKVVARDLLSPDLMIAKLDTPTNRQRLKDTVMTEFKVFIDTKFKTANPMLAMLAGEGLITQITGQLDTMLDGLLPKLFAELGNQITEDKVERMVEERVLGFDDEKFEALLMSVIKKELGFIEAAGAILGFIIGCIQVGIFILVSPE